MKIPSIHQMLQDAGSTVRRFPLVLLLSAVGTMASIILIEHEGSAEPTVLFRVLLGALLGMPLLVMISLWAERAAWRFPASLGIQGAGLLAVAGYALTLPVDLPNAPTEHMMRFAMIAAGLVLFVSVVPFARGGAVNGFWQYNKALLLRALTAIFFSGVLFAGLAIALGAIDNLFGIHVPPKRYGELWACVAGLFTTWFFLAGVPESLDALESARDYPRVIKLFAQYILLPLVLVYLVILYAYLGKVVLAWEWPQGWVSRLILGFASAGMLMHLLLYPVQGHEGNVWITRASRWFYLVMAPLVVVFFLAVTRRTSEYGLTEGRYIAIVTGVWLAVMILYFLFSRRKDIRLIPGSLGAIVLLISFGPWGAFRVSEGSQVSRLEQLLGSAGLLVDGKAHAAAKTVPYEASKEISAVIGYLHEVHGYERIQPWFTFSLASDSAGGTGRVPPDEVVKRIGIDYVRNWGGMGLSDVSLRADGSRPSDVAGYDRLLRLHVSRDPSRRRVEAGEGVAYRVSPDIDTLVVYAGKGGAAEDSVVVDVRGFVDRLLQEHRGGKGTELPPETLAVAASSGDLRVKFCLLSIFARRQDERLNISTYECAILYRRQPASQAPMP